jgi:hypothetical protein
VNADEARTATAQRLWEVARDITKSDEAFRVVLRRAVDVSDLDRLPLGASRTFEAELGGWL